MQTIEAVIDEQGHVCLRSPVRLPLARRALVTILDEPPEAELDDRALTLLSEQALAVDWDRPEEDEAWAHLQSGG